MLRSVEEIRNPNSSCSLTAEEEPANYPVSAMSSLVNDSSSGVSSALEMMSSMMYAVW